ncbi:hypothetical protein ACFW1A_36355 [Kitasatospora sp. NPDC058965]|uniref:hypothetical protein n=1 Tax=Kitasatospora sp. NPDC058965 TaxID=3346682 RepID=UPI0036782462
MSRAALPTTEAAVAAVTALARRHGRALAVEHDIGADRTFAGAVGAVDAALPHEALLELAGRPAVRVRLFTHDEALVTVEGVDVDVPRDRLPAFLDAVYGGLAHVKVRAFPPARTLKIAVPGEPTYREHVDLMTPWLWSVAR